ncbi:MAG TPA: sulfatase [Draconibacterium sp.]|nr:sulfatase [Draconibacterium sp.]
MNMIKIFILLSILTVFNSSFGQPKSQQEYQKHNVLFIAVDDLKPLLNCYGESQIISPNIDKLAKSGAVFLNNQCQQAVCSPSRASLMFGMRPDKTKVWDLNTPVRTATKDKKTVAQHFKNNGYETSAFGKIFHISMADKEHDTESWSISYSKINIENYPENIGTPFAGHYQEPEVKKEQIRLYNSYINEGLNPGKARAKVLETVKPSTEMLDMPDDAYGDGQIANNSVKMIQRLANKDKPFFIAVGFKKPHLPFVAPKKYWDLYTPEKIELSEYQKAPENAPDFAMHSWGELKSYSDINPAIQANGLLKEEKQRELIHGYMAAVSYTDANIGKLLDELENQGVADKTIVVLWGDHGWHLGDHGIWCKHSNFEQATRAPLIFSSPEMKKGIKNSSPVEFIDIYPTLCDLAGIEIPDFTDGKSLKPILAGKAEKVKDYAISQYPRGNNRMGYSLRNERYRYTAWYAIDFRKGEKATSEKIIAEELYDYQNDKLEMKNLAEQDSYTKVKSDLAEMLNEFLKL